MEDSKQKRMAQLLIGLLLYSFVVFLWGAWVRISGSGDGCGEHWPFCHGELIPDSYAVQVWIENFHRISTKLYGFFVIGLCVLAFRWYPKGHPTRSWVLAILAFTLIEGLIGAVIVLKGFVADDDSPERAGLIAIHLANTFLLVGTIIGSHVTSQWPSSVQSNVWRATQRGLRIVMAICVLVGATGALAALSTTLFPSTSLLQGFVSDFQADSHFLLKIRISHPILAISLLLLGWALSEKWKTQFQRQETLRWVSLFRMALIVGFLSGVLTLGLLSPTVMKLTHLLIAHLLWSALCYLAFHMAREKHLSAPATRQTP